MALAQKDNKQPSILFINRIFPPDKGATALRLYEMAMYMAHQGWRVTILTAKGREEIPKGMHENLTVRRMGYGSMVHPVPFSEYPRLLIEFAWALLWTKSHDVTVTMTDPPLLACVSPILRMFKRTKLVHWSHDVYPEIFPVLGIKFPKWLMFIMKRKMNFALRRHHKVVVIGRDMARFMVEKKGVSKDKIHIINNWPDTFFDRFEVAEKHENPFILKDRMTFLYSGNFGLAHEFETLLQGIKLLEPKEYPVRFLLVGQGRQLEDIQDRVAELDLKTVQFLSYQPESKVKDLLDAGDVHLATMKSDALGLLMPSKVNSAFAMKKPIIFFGPEGSEGAKLISEHKAGFVIDINDENSQFTFAKVVADLVLNKHTWAECAEGSTKCRKKISMESMAGLFEQMARSLLR